MQLEDGRYILSSFKKSSEYFQRCNLTVVKNILTRHTVPRFEPFCETTAWLDEQVHFKGVQKRMVSEKIAFKISKKNVVSNEWHSGRVL